MNRAIIFRSFLCAGCTLVLLNCGAASSSQNSPSVIKSLTSEKFVGKKYYLGYGGQAEGSQTNEIIYDVKHTSDVFTSLNGGQYIGKTLLDPEATRESVLGAMTDIKNRAGAEDMYIQYSSGHGFESGSQAGGDMLDYSEIRDQVLGMKVKEAVVFLMACHSGGLPESFNERRSDWQKWPEQGRSLFVMSSSTIDEMSSSGPDTDSDESAGESGSAGSAFGHYLWKSLLGYADGYVDGVADGFISLEEIGTYVTAKTAENFGHTPQITGAYNPYAIMNKATKKWQQSDNQDSGQGQQDGMQDQ